MNQDDKASKKMRGHIVLSAHPAHFKAVKMPINWGDSNPMTRAPVIASLTNPEHRNAIGTHSGAYSLHRALAVAAGALKSEHKPDLTNTTPPVKIGPHPQWFNKDKIVSLDPFGHMVADVYADLIKEGFDIRPSIAVTKAHINMPEIQMAIKEGRIKPDGLIVQNNGDVTVTKAAIEPVWHLPGVAARFGISEAHLRRTLFEETAGMFPELITRSDLDVFLPPIGGTTVYFFGDVEKVHLKETRLSCRIHDECNGSDVFGSDICTCRPYLVHGIEHAIKTAQEGGAGIIVYNRKEGRALGEVTKFLVYNARKRQLGGDTAQKYFERTECVAGVQDVRFQELNSDVLHWLGVEKIDHFVSMSNMKYDALSRAGIVVHERVPIPDHLIPADAKVEMVAKMAAGYFSSGKVIDINELSTTCGRDLDEKK